MMLNNWFLIFDLTFLFSGLIGILCQIILRLTLDRRVRKELSAGKVYDGFYDGFFGIWRALIFANAGILKAKRFKRVMVIFYEGFDVTHFANRFEKNITWIHLIVGIIFFSCLIFYFLTMWLGIVRWSDV
jgi:hypothetical protein